jgi:FtsP/CotA-like multicopper oxidase with cupredoxin domain
MQAAVYDALVAIEGGYQPYAYEDIGNLVGLDASREAAVAAAAYGVLNHYVPSVTLTEIYNAMVAAIADGPEKDAGILVGQAAADAIVALRTGDDLLAPDTYILPAPAIGVWQPNVMPDGTIMPPIDPWMAQLEPFLRLTSDQYRPPAPYDLTSPEYAADLNEVKEIGGAGSLVRTPAQTEVATFWTDNMVIMTNSAYRQVAESRGLNLIETARLMAMGNMVATDSLIFTFDSKYTYNFWRPVAAIRNADVDGNDLTTGDSTWMPALPTPNFPEYVAGHGSFVSSQAELLTQLFGQDINLDLSSRVTGTTRHFATAADMRTEIINARTWGGMHFRTSSVLAVATGQQLVLDAVTSNFLADPLTDTLVHATVAGGIRKFVDTLPGLTAANANNLGKYIPVAVPEVRTYNGIEADYYEIAVVQYEEKFHSDLPPTLLRGYVQVSTTAVPGEGVQLTNTLLDGTVVNITGFLGVTPPHYLGPTIVATKDRPVRIKFYNLLPTGVDGNLFIPVDTTVMGSGMGQYAVEDPLTANPQIPMCDMETITDDCYTENRATLHLHGGITPWISDGTPHQWITPANELTAYPEGVSVVPVPDMLDDTGNPNDGVMTFYYTNQQSARLMFYHDHAWGITRLNVYAGEAAPYIITDATEQALLTAGLIPDADSTIPLVIQDKTFVPNVVQMSEEDETWDYTRWGDTGDLWLPHVYSPAQNPGDSSGVNQFGRWAYGPWFWPPTIGIDNGPIPNPYFDANCNPDVQWCEPEMMPGVPFNSMGMEAFMDTPVVNGTAYPTLEVDPKSYRFRILNAANDRFFNLSFYKAIDANGNPCDLSINPNPVVESTGVACTEVALADVDVALADPTVFPTPVAGSEGPSWIQIANEGGFLPAPAELPAHPTTWVNDPTVFNAGNVDLHSLLIAPAERADVVVDFSAFAGQTIILYNDAPAAFPARDPRYDYYTGNGDYRDTGGAPSTLAGYGPNTRTVMKIVVAPVAPAPAFNLPALENAFKAESLGGLGVFENGQHPTIVGQGAYNSAYGTSFQNNGPLAGLAQIFDTSLTFNTLSGNILTMPFQPKMIQDEMGEAFEQEYGRMSGNLGVESPNPQAGNQNMILYNFVDPPTEVLNGIQLPPGVELAPISSTDDGTQIWKITHNGVDTHPIHFHLYDVQLINRVGWDGIIRKPEANELGWKDTVRISPLEDTIVALKPLIPQLPSDWDLPNSIRLLDPSMPDGAVLASSTQAEAAGLVPMAFDPTGEPIDIFNHYVNFGWEYVWHCHILSHEEMDMMRSVVVGVDPNAPSGLTAVLSGSGKNQIVTLTWLDNSMNDTSFTVERALTGDGPWTAIAFIQSPIEPTKGTTVSFTDPIGNTKSVYFYRVVASNTIGDTWDYSDPNLNEGASFPTLNLYSIYSDVATFGTAALTPPAAPTNLTATLQVGPQAMLTWIDNSNDETGFVIERSVDGSIFSILAQVGTGITSYTDSTISAGSTFTYRVKAVNSAGSSTYSNTATVSLALPAAPSNLTAGVVRKGNNVKVTLTWVDNASNENGFTVQWASDAAFTNLISSASVAVNATTFTTPNLARGTAYYFRIRAFNDAGVSAWVNALPFPIVTP